MLPDPGFHPAETSVASEWWRGARASLPVMLGFVPFALVLGAQVTEKGLHPVVAPLMTGLNFGGGSEFVALRLWHSPPHVALIVAMSFLVNCRHILMGAVLAPCLADQPRRRVLPALFFMCDESWAMALADARARGATRLSLPYYLGVSACLYLTWVSVTGLGAWLGPVLGDAGRYGFDMAFIAVFLVLLKGMWRGARTSLPWLVSLLAAASVYLWQPDAAWHVPAGAVCGLACAAWQGGRT